MLIFVLRTRAYMLSKDDQGGKEGSTAVVQTASRFFFFLFFLLIKKNWEAVWTIQLFLSYKGFIWSSTCHFSHPMCWTSWLYHHCLQFVGGSAELPADPNEEDANDGNKLIEDGKAARYDDHLTPAERRYIEQRESIDVHRLAKTSNKSHRDRIQDFNQYLANMSEHYDIPKVGPGWVRKAFEFEGIDLLFVNVMRVLYVPSDSYHVRFIFCLVIFFPALEFEYQLQFVKLCMR